MRRVLLVLLVCLSSASFVSAQQADVETDASGLWFGITGFYDEEISSDEIWDGTFFNGDVSLGIDTRLRFDLVELSFLAISNPFSNDDDRYLMFLNAGGNLSLPLVNLGAGFGMNFDYNDATEDTVDYGVNTKFSADIMFGSFAFGGYYMALADSFGDFEFDDLEGYVGLSMLIKM